MFCLFVVVVVVVLGCVCVCKLANRYICLHPHKLLVGHVVAVEKAARRKI